MRELLIRNGKPDFKTIIALALPPTIIGLCGMYNLLEGIFYRGFDLAYTIRFTAEVLFTPLITLIAWSLALHAIKPPNKALDIIIPGAALALAWIILRFILNRTYGFEEQQPIQYIMYFAWPFISNILFVLIANVLYNAFRNKILAYVLAGCIHQIISMTWVYLMQPELQSIGLIFSQIPEFIIQFFLTVYFFKLMRLPYSASTETQQRENHLRENIRHALANNTAREQLLDLLRPQFPDLSPAHIVRTISRTANPVDIRRARGINTTIIILLSLTCIPFIIFFFTQFPNRIDLTLDGLELITSLLSLAVLVFICIRLYLLGTLVEYQPHAYIILAILAGIGMLAHIVGALFLGYPSFELAVFSTLGIGFNTLALFISLSLYRQLYPSTR